jgi:hypothetical protein
MKTPSTKFAFLVGINRYPGAPLHGCANDVMDMAQLLTSVYGFEKKNITLLLDERATTEKITSTLRRYAYDLSAGDQLVFHYSGHGAQIPSTYEDDGLDEVICPIDFNWTPQHLIRDKDFKSIFQFTSHGSNIIWISDSCHSGDLSKDLTKNTFRGRFLTPPLDIHWHLDALKENKDAPELGMGKALKAQGATLFAACRDHQTADDATFGKNNRPNGAFTYFLLQELRKKTLPLNKILTNVRASLKKAGFKQVPQLEGNTGNFTKPFIW